MEELYQSLRERRRPEDVAHMLVPLLKDELDRRDIGLLVSAARLGGRRRGVASSMSATFFKPVDMTRQTEKCREIFRDAPEAPAQRPDDVQRFMEAIGQEIGWTFGASEMHDRFTKEERKALFGDALSKRRYNKLFRKLRRMEQKHHRWRKTLDVTRFSQVAKSGLASELLSSEFFADEGTACFIAYFTARASLRSEFIAGPQKRAFDEVTEMLFRRLIDAPGTNWWAVAHVHPDPTVLDMLGAVEKGRLLARWFGLLEDIAQQLKTCWERSGFDRAQMIVRRGDDSSTWNALAGAWNQARRHWITLLHSLQMQDMLHAVCPGKTMRLMAADIVMMHAAGGGGLDPNTQVWASLPAPWEVLAGDAVCTLSDVERVCRTHGLDAKKSGWTAPKPKGRVERFVPTPELVHGVTVESPELATLLRNAGVFSGKGVR